MRMRKIHKAKRTRSQDPCAILDRDKFSYDVAAGISTRPTADRSISAVSLNLAKVASAHEVLNAISNAPRLRDADVLLFQEVVNEKGSLSTAEEVARELGYFAAFKAGSSVYDQGLALVSRYAITNVRVKPLKTYNLRFHNRNRFAMAATLRTPGRDIQVWNVHLDTRINAGDRLDQLKPVIHETPRFAGPQLIGGDFNTNELYWLKNLLPMPGGASHRNVIRKAMKEHGFEAPFSGTLNTFPMLRRQLDWIFVRDLIPLETSVEFVPCSDHNALWVRLCFQSSFTSPEQPDGVSISGSIARDRVPAGAAR